MKEITIISIIAIFILCFFRLANKETEMRLSKSERQAFLAGMDYQNRRIRQFDCVPDSILMPPLTEVIDSNLVR